MVRRAFPQDALRIRRQPEALAHAIENARDALGAQRDGRQRILQFVSDAARHFVPGRGLLGAQQFAGVFQHHHETLLRRGLRGQRGNRDGQVQHLRRSMHLNLAGGDAGTARALHQVVDFGRVLARKQIAQVRGALYLLLRQQALQRAIHALDAAVRAQRDHAGRDAFENRLR